MEKILNIEEATRVFNSLNELRQIRATAAITIGRGQDSIRVMMELNGAIYIYYIDHRQLEKHISINHFMNFYGVNHG